MWTTCDAKSIAAIRATFNDAGVMTVGNKTEATLTPKKPNSKPKLKKSSPAAPLRARRENWAESDRLRDDLAALGVAIKDNKDGTTSWET